MMSFKEILDMVYHLDSHSIELMQNETVLIHYNKEDNLVTQGHRCNSIFFNADGICRAYCHMDGREDTRWFATAGDVFTSMSAWHNNQPAFFSIGAVTPVSCYVMDFQAMRKLLDCDVRIREWAIKLLAESLYVLEKRYTIIGCGSARERYEALIKGRPMEIINSIPLKYIASYLKITQETLSRARRIMTAHTAK